MNLLGKYLSSDHKRKPLIDTLWLFTVGEANMDASKTRCGFAATFAAFAILAMPVLCGADAVPDETADRSVPRASPKPPKKTLDGRKLIDKSVDASAITSDQASAGMVLTADGSGGATWSSVNYNNL